MENKHQNYDLAQMQSLPLDAKIRMTERRIRDWYEAFDGEVYVSVSGGKDSQVLAHIVKNLYPDVPCVFVNTGLEYDSVRKKGIELSDEVLIPEMNFVKVIEKYGYPMISKEVSRDVAVARNNPDGKTAQKFIRGSEFHKKYGDRWLLEKWAYLIDAPFKISNQCCNIMKKTPAHKFNKESGLYPIIGTMACESVLRKKEWLRSGCNAFSKENPSSQPISFWTEQDILQYIKQNDLCIASIYGDVVYVDNDGMLYDNDLFNNSMKLKTTGFDRTGCVFCMFGITQDKDRFLRLKEFEPKKYDFVMRGGKFDESGMWIPHNGLGYKFIIDWLNEHGGLNIRY